MGSASDGSKSLSINADCGSRLQRRTKVCAAIAVALLFGGLAPTSHASIIATDDANTGGYAPQPDHGWAGFNGGTGYNLWTPLADTGGGGTYMEGVGVNNRQVDGNYSFSLYSGSGSYDISRPLTSSVTTGEFDILTRFDIAGAGPNLVNLRAGNNLAGFGSGELLSFGIVNGNELSYTDGSGFHLLSSGEARGDVWSWDVVFNAGAGTYTLNVSQVGGGYSSGPITGSLESSGTSVGSFAVINSSTGNNQNVIFDDPTFSTVPEPAALSLIGGVMTMLSFRRRKA